MPHVVLKGKVVVDNIFKELEPLFIKNHSTILKTLEVYIERSKKDAIVEALAIEEGKKTVFLVLISSREDGLVIRLYPKIEIEKTDGVKKILAEIAKQIITKFPELKVGETNLQDYLK